MAALEPLRRKARAVEAQRVLEQEAAVRRWQQSERPALKDFAHTLRETETIQRSEIKQLQQRLREFTSSEVPNQPSSGGPQPHRVTTGFNVIRSRAGADGKPLPTDALRAERQRLIDTLAQLNVEIASAKAELTDQRRLEEQEIWETKLVALQDTKRVYREEVNLIEVELLGREHAERIHHDRELAESTGLARLQRLEEQALQTRIKYNRAKHQYYFPHVKGYNITFGGGGIYGACKDICISEITGSINITAEAPAASSSGEQRARLVINFEAAKASRGGAVKRSDTQGLGASTAVGTAAPSEGRAPSSSAGPCARSASALSESGLGRWPSSATAPQQQHPDGQQLAGVRRSATFPSTAAPRTAPQDSHRADGHTPALLSRDAAHDQAPAAGEAALPPLPPSAPKAKQKNMAMKFLSKLGSKKEKYSGKQKAELEPITEEPDSAGGKRRQTLASKLLGRKSSRVSSARADGGLEELKFGSVAAAVPVLQRDVGGSAVDRGPAGDLSSRLSDRSFDASDDEAGELDDARRMAAVSLHVEQHSEGDGSLASEDEEDDLQAEASRVGLRQGAASRSSLSDAAEAMSRSSGGRSMHASLTGSRRSWLQQRPQGNGAGDTASMWDDGASTADSDLDAEVESSTLPAGSGREGVYCRGRVGGFELVGERGTKVPNLTIGQGDVEANVYVRFVFEYSKLGGWRPADKPLFDVQHLKHKLQGNNVPMPATLIKHILRVAIPGLIQRKLLGVLPKELGEYLLSAKQGFMADADVAIVGPALSVLDADLAFEVCGPAKTSREARTQQQKYAAAKDARSMLGLSLPQAQLLGMLFGGSCALFEPPRPVSIAELIALQAAYDHHPKLYGQLCGTIGAAYRLLADDRLDADDFDFRAFMDEAVTRVRRKPARARVTMRHMDVAMNVDAAITMVHDFTQRALEELVIKGPVANPKDNPEILQESLEEQLELLHAWHAWLLNELSHFKSKFRGSGGTLLGAADHQNFSAGVENFFYEGPLRLRMPVSMELDSDGAFSFDLPLPSPIGDFGKFVDGFKSLVVPAHLRPPEQSINWVPNLGDQELDRRMRQQVQTALGMISEVLTSLNQAIKKKGLERQDEDPQRALSQPRTLVGDKLGRFIVNRLKARVLLDERRISEILSGIDSSTMGAGFVTNAGRLLGHLGDLVTLAFTPVASQGDLAGAGSQYLLQLESSDISRLRADVQSLGFQSHVTPGGMVRLAHAVIRSFFLSFKHQTPEEIRPFVERMQAWYRLMTRRALEVSLCVDIKGSAEGGDFVVHVAGTADDARVRETSPMVLTNDIDLVPLGKAMRGDP